MPRPIVLLVILLAVACGGDLVGPSAAVLEVSTVTTGAPLDPDGYAFHLDDRQPAEIGTNATLAVQDLAAGEHQLELDGVAPNCVLAAPNPRTVTVEAGRITRVRFEVRCGTFDGRLEVSVTSSGESPDPDGYLVGLDDGAGVPVASDGTVTFSNVPAGAHRVGLSGLSPNCAMQGDNPTKVTVGSGRTRVDLEVRCGPPSGSIRIVTTTVGPQPDLDGYVAAVNGEEHAVGSNATIVVAGVPVGDVVVELSGVAPNCVLQDDRTRTIPLLNGVTYTVNFDVICLPITEGLLLFSSNRSGVYHLYRTRLDGSQLRDLTPSFEAFSGDWSPDGTRIVLAAAGSLYVMNADGSASVVLGIEGSGPKWSPDGRKILFIVGGVVTVMSADGTGVTTLGDGGNARWSPDGTRIVFDRIIRSRCVYDLFCPSEIFTMAADGTGVTRLVAAANGSDQLVAPAWSPDGTRIAYVRHCCFFGPDASGIYVVSVKGDVARRLFTGPVGGGPVWSPDGSALAFAAGRPNGTTELTIVPATGGVGVVLASSPGYEYPHAWR
jgi:Tol biopolymer transport system component